MSLQVNTYVDIDDDDVIEALSDASDAKLVKYGLRRCSPDSRVVVVPPGFGHETPIPEQIRLAAVRGDLPAFIEHTRQLLDEEGGVFIRTDHLLAKLREVSHAD